MARCGADRQGVSIGWSVEQSLCGSSLFGGIGTSKRCADPSEHMF